MAQSESRLADLNVAQDAVAITKNDTTVLSPIPRALFVGGAGDIAVRTVIGSTVTFTIANVPFVLNLACDKVMSTGTSATLIMGLY